MPSLKNCIACTVAAASLTFGVRRTLRRLRNYMQLGIEVSNVKTIFWRDFPILVAGKIFVNVALMTRVMKPIPPEARLVWINIGIIGWKINNAKKNANIESLETLLRPLEKKLNHAFDSTRVFEEPFGRIIITNVKLMSKQGIFPDGTVHLTPIHKLKCWKTIKYIQSVIEQYFRDACISDRYDLKLLICR